MKEQRVNGRSSFQSDGNESLSKEMTSSEPNSGGSLRRNSVSLRRNSTWEGPEEGAAQSVLEGQCAESRAGGAIAGDVKEATGCWFVGNLTGHSGVFVFHFGCDEKLLEGFESGIVMIQFMLPKAHSEWCLENGYLMSPFMARG